MNKYLLLFFTFIFPLILLGQGDEIYWNTLTQFEKSLTKSKVMPFKKAVFLTENAYFNGQLNRGLYDANIQLLEKLTIAAAINYPIQYQQEDSTKVKVYAALFKVFSDTIGIRINEENYYHFQFDYDFEDIFGSKDWKNTFVTKLGKLKNKIRQYYLLFLNNS